MWDFIVASRSSAVGVYAVALAGVDRRGGAHRLGLRVEGRSAAVRVDARAFAGGQGSVRAHPPPPSGSSPGPSPAAREVWVFILRSRWGPWRRRRAGRCPCRHRRECGSACSSCLPVQVQPSGSMPGPSPAAIEVCVFIRHLRWDPWRRRSRCRRVPSCPCSSHSLVRGRLSRRAGRCRRRRRREFRSGSSSFVRFRVLSPPAPRTRRGREGFLGVGRAQGPGQPPGNPTGRWWTGSRREPRWRRSSPCSLRCAGASALRVDAGSVAGADVCRGAHVQPPESGFSRWGRCTPCSRRGPASACSSCLLSLCAVRWLRTEAVPAGAVVQPNGRCRRRRRRESWSGCSSSSPFRGVSAVGVDAAAAIGGADLRGDAHLRLLS
jgi:hypothetical protein